jgi:small subunit ribosomal protein S2
MTNTVPTQAITLEELMSASVHYGHQTRRWNPKMKPFIWGERNGIYILDLTKTVPLFNHAYEFLKQAAAQGKRIVFVCTKRQGADIIEEEAKRAGVYYITKRWIGGMLTNYETIRTRINRLRELEEMSQNGHFARLPKKEVSVLNRELAKLQRMFGGVKEIRGIPDVIFVVDMPKEHNAILEANKAGVPVVAICDTNCDPTLVDYIIPGNDDALKAVRLITSRLADAIIAGRESRKDTATVRFEDKADKADEAAKVEG